MYHLIPVPFSIVLIVLYTIARTRFDMEKTKILQPLMSFLVIIIALLSLTTPNVNRGYTILITAALIVAFVSDIFHIDMRKDNVLIIGIIGFSIAYSIYPVAFTIYNGFHWQDIITAVPLVMLYAFSLKKLWNHLGSLRVPALIYCLICPVMVHRAVSTFFGDAFTTAQAVILSAATLMLYLGDLEYAVHRFLKPRKFLFGHICYGLGQLLVALSCSYFA
ncbi:MAG: lysoplasmalogenase [Spirochaetales bacterium]|nr:lysoplasmalogenase [Spirochaetales bacterium]